MSWRLLCSFTVTTAVEMPDEVVDSATKDSTFRWFLPVEIVSSTGAITIGLPDLPSILILHYKEASGSYEAVKSRSIHDYYRTDLNLAFKKMKASLCTNVDYREPVLNQAARIRSHNAKRPWYRELATFMTGGMIWGASKEEQIMLEDAETHWAGLSRYKLANVPMIKRRRFEEYAQVSTVLECKRLDLRYYADVPGPAPKKDAKSSLSGDMPEDDAGIGNGDLPPEWGTDVTVTDSAMHYGPWTDRQRGMLQKFFFPVAYRNSSKTEKLSPGAIRTFLALKVLLKFQGSTSFRVPFREQSKDWRHYDDALGDDENANIKVGSTGRPYAWIDLKTSSNGAIDITVPFIMGEAGYITLVHVALDNVSVISSLNYAPILVTQSLKVECQLHSPLQWNAGRVWLFNITMSSMQMFLLRDHVTLLTDLVKDWSTGPPTSQEFFVPMTYKIKLAMTDFDLHFCVNQNNVINSPNDLADNTYLILSGPRLRLDFDLPFMMFEAESTIVGFQIESKKTRVTMSFPKSHTIGSFMTDKAREVGTAGHLIIAGTYRYHRAVAPGLIDCLAITLEASSVSLVIYGYLVSHLIFFKENYLGEHNSFITSDEYRSRMADPLKTETAWRKQEATKEVGNSFEVIILVSVQSAIAMLPESLYDLQDVTILNIGEIQAESRSNEFYHDVHVILQPIRWTRGSVQNSVAHPQADIKKNFICVQDFAIRGHRLFGLPPKGAVYAADWRVTVGPIIGELQPSALPAVQRALRCFGFHYANVNNVLTMAAIAPDITTVLATIQSLHVSIWGLGSVTTLQLAHGIRLQLDNLVNPKWTERIFVEIPEILLRCLAVTTENTDAGPSEESIWVEVFKGTTALSICLYSQTPQWEIAQKLQMDYIKAQDEITKRCAFLWENETDAAAASNIPRRKPTRAQEPGKRLPFLPIFSPPFELSPDHRVSRRPACSKEPASEAAVSQISLDVDPDSDVSDDEYDSDMGEQDGDWFDGSVQHGNPAQAEPPPPPRSIPYRSYLRRFAIDRSSSSPLHSLYAGRGPTLTVFTELEPDGSSDGPLVQEPYMERPFSALVKKYKAANVAATVGKVDEQATVISVDFSEAVKVRITPITLRILQEVLENLRAQAPNPETIMDGLEISHTNSLIKTYLFPLATSSVFLSAPIIQLHCIQDMLLPDVTSFLQQGAAARSELSDKLLCSFDIILTGLSSQIRHTVHRSPGSTATTFVENKFLVTLDRVTTKLRFVGNMNAVGVIGIPPGKQSHRGHSEKLLEGIPVVLDLLADKIQWTGHVYRHPEPADGKLTGISLNLSTKELSVVSINETIEVLFGAIFKWATFGIDVGRLLQSFAVRERRELQSLITMIAEKAHENAVGGDPAFMTQPSTLWMLGTRKHQEDSGWKLIAHLRYCLRSMPLAVRLGVQTALGNGTLPNTDSKVLFVAVLKYLSAWRRWEVADLPSASMLRELFNVKPLPSSANAKPSAEPLTFLCNGNFSLKLTKLSVTVFEFQNDDSSIIIGPILISGRSNLHDHGPEDFDAVPPPLDHLMSESYQSLEKPKQALEVRSWIQIERLDCIVNPNLFGFVRHFVRVQRWFQARLESATRSDAANHVPQSHSSIQAKESVFSQIPISIFGTAMINKITLAATAHNLVAKTTMRSLHISSAHVVDNPHSSYVLSNGHGLGRAGQETRWGPDRLVHSTLGTLVGVDVVMYEKAFRTTQASDANTLISLTFDDVSASASISESLQNKLGPLSHQGRRLSLVFGVRYVGLRLPRSLLKLHAFLEKWGDEDLPRYDFLFNNLVKEWDGGSKSISLRRQSMSRLALTSGDASPSMDIEAEFLLGHLSIQSDLLSTLNVFYDARDLLVGVSRQDARSIAGAKHVLRTSWEARLREHGIKFLNKPNSSAPSQEGGTVDDVKSFELPTVSSIGAMSQCRTSDGSSHSGSSSGIGEDSLELLEQTRLEATIELDKVEANVDVSILDQLITTQSVFGGELNDVLDVFAFYGRKQSRKAPRKPASDQSDEVSQPKMLFALKLTMQGLRIAADSPDSVIIFESDSINGFVMNHPQSELTHNHAVCDPTVQTNKVLWRVAAKRFSFSLIKHSGNWQTWMAGARSKVPPVAYVVMGVTAQNYGTADGAVLDDVKMLIVRFHQLYAVLQPNAMTGLTDVALYYMKELERRSQLKAQELAKAKENTERFIKGIRLPLPDKKRNQSFFEERVVIVEILQICAALPLRREGEKPASVPINRSTTRRRSTISSQSDAMPAFLISAKAVNLSSKRLRSSLGSIIDLCFQFVPNFDAGNERHYSPLLHPTSNRILLQQTTAQVLRTKTDLTHFVRLGSGIKGFEMELDASVTGYVNQLNAIYMNEKEYVVMSVPQDSRASIDSVAPDPVMLVPKKPSDTTRASAGDFSSNGDKAAKEDADGLFFEFDARFAFEAATCKIWSSRKRGKGTSERSAPISSSQLSTGSASQKTDGGAPEDPSLHVLILPGITLTTTGKTVVGELSKHPELEELAKGVHIDLVIHSSNNVLHPEILHFANDVTANLKVGRLIEHQEQLQTGAGSSTSVMEEKTTDERQRNTPAAGAYQRHAITFNLRLNHTKLSLSCQPVSKVSCNFNLEEADFMFSFVPKVMRKDKTQYLSCTGTILGTSGALRHAFSPEDCVNLEIARITFNVTTMERKLNRTYAVEMGVPSLMGNLNARHLQDFFLFQRMWFDNDRLPRTRSSVVRNSLGGLQPERRTYGSSLLSFVGDDGRSLKDAVHLAARINQIEVAADLGQAIGKATITLDNLVISGNGIRSMLGFQEKEVSLKFETLSVKSEGKFSGTAAITGAQAYFIAREPPAPKRGQNESSIGTELVLRIDSLTSQLHYQYERILILHIAPIHGGFTDKWISSLGDLQLRVDVDFTIDTFKGIMSRRTIPTMIQLVKRVMALIEEKRGADQAATHGTGSSTRRDASVSGLSSTYSGVALGRTAQSQGSLMVDVGPAMPVETNIRGREYLNGFWMGASSLGTIKVVLDEAFIVLARYNFRDPDFAQVSSKRIAATYSGLRGTTGQAVEDTIVHLGGLNVKKGTAKSISQVEESIWTTAQWFTFMTSAATKNVFGVRDTKVMLKSETFFTEPLVEYSFRTDFSGPIDVALNFALYKYLQDLAQLYQKAVTKSAESASDEGSAPRGVGVSPTGSASTRARSPGQAVSATSTNSATPTLDSPIYGKRTSPRDTVAGSPEGAPSATGADDPDPSPKLAFVRKGEMVFEPQLKVTGDATPWEWVQWLGVHKEKVPRLVYDQVTVNLAQLVDAVSGFHRQVAIPIQDASEAVTIDVDGGPL
ncbi:hypothetical protein HKX48_005162 [Thoreauomyces humboldtii]|nr:hypothetical protein HKX48_005162 [Thoreauomyces humboldtii]